MVRYRDLEYELEEEFEDEYEFEYEAPPPALRIRIVHGRSWGADREFEDEGDFFDPVPPPAGARLLTRFAYGGATLTATHRRMIVQLAKDLLSNPPKGDLDCLDVTIVAADPEKILADLRKKRGKDIWLFGGGSLFRSLLELRLVFRREAGRKGTIHGRNGGRGARGILEQGRVRGKRLHTTQGGYDELAGRHRPAWSCYHLALPWEPRGREIISVQMTQSGNGIDPASLIAAKRTYVRAFIQPISAEKVQIEAQLHAYATESNCQSLHLRRLM